MKRSRNESERNLRFARDPNKKSNKETAKGLGVAKLAENAGGFLRRSMKVFLAILTTLAAVSLLGAGVLVAYMALSKSDFFTVKKIVISGINQVSRQEILKAAGLAEDALVRIWSFEPEKAEENLRAIAWLDTVEVDRQMPDTVTIKVTEHQPRLLISLGRLYYLNESGEPFKELAPGENPKLPIVSGFGTDELLSPSPSMRTAIGEIFTLVEVLSKRNDEFRLANISEINYDMVRGLTLFTKNKGLEVKVGLGSYAEKFRRLGRVLAHLKVEGKYDRLVYLNLEASPRVIVRYGDRVSSASYIWRGKSLLLEAQA